MDTARCGVDLQIAFVDTEPANAASKSRKASDHASRDQAHATQALSSGVSGTASIPLTVLGKTQIREML